MKKMKNCKLLEQDLQSCLRYTVHVNERFTPEDWGWYEENFEFSIDQLVSEVNKGGKKGVKQYSRHLKELFKALLNRYAHVRIDLKGSAVYATIDKIAAGEF